MKIAFVSQGNGLIDPPRIYGSISIWTYNVLCELRKTENVIAYESSGGRIRSRIKEYDGVKFIYVPVLFNRVINRLHRKFRRAEKAFAFALKPVNRPIFNSVWNNLGYILWVSLHLRTQHCDVIHLHQFSQYIPIIRMFNRSSKIVLHMHSEWLTQLDKALIRKRIQKADLIIGCSNYIAEKIKHAFPEFKEKIKTVRNGVDHEQFKMTNASDSDRNSHRFQILLVGRVSPEKGIHLAIGAVKKLVKDYPSIHLNIVGGIGSAPREYILDLSNDVRIKRLAQFYGENPSHGSYYFECLKRMVGDEFKSYISFSGSVPHEKVIDFYQKADIFVNSSLSDAAAMPLAEAMASGLPVIATRVGGTVNIVENGISGLLVEPGDEEELSEAIKNLIENPELRRKMGKTGRQRVLEKFLWEKVAAALLNEYRSILCKIPT